jgi:tetratricopeptide (TPR) repeat protein
MTFWLRTGEYSMRSTYRTCLTVLLMFVLPVVACADDSWVGRVVIPKQPGVKFGQTDPKTGTEVVFGTLEGMMYKVLAEKDGFLRVRQNDKEGWFPKGEAVPVENAVDFFTNLIRANPKDIRAYVHRAAALVWKGDFDAALRDYDEAIRLDPKVSRPWNNRGSAYYAKKDYEKAIKDFDKAIEIDPKYVDAYFNRATTWLDSNQPDKAIKDYDDVVRLDPTFIDAYINRGVCWRQKKQFDKALRDYDEALRLDPQCLPALNSKAFLLATCPDAKFRDGKKAVELARKACDIEEWKNNGFIDTLAAAHAEAGQFDEAVKWMTKALADEEYAKQAGDTGRKMLELYKQKKAFRDE